MNSTDNKEIKKLGKVGGVRVAEPLAKGELFKFKPLSEVFLFENITLEEHLKRLEGRIQAQNDKINTLTALTESLINAINNNQKITSSAIELIMQELEKGRVL